MVGTRKRKQTQEERKAASKKRSSKKDHESAPPLKRYRPYERDSNLNSLGTSSSSNSDVQNQLNLSSDQSSSSIPSPKSTDENLPINPVDLDKNGDCQEKTSGPDLHESAAFKKYLRDVRCKSIEGNWKQFDFEKAAQDSRFSKVRNFLREKKPNLKHLLFNGALTGYYKCIDCEERGHLHIIKACLKDVNKFRVQNVELHFNSKVHKETESKTNTFSFSQDWRKSMDILYLKLMAKQRVTGGIFKSGEFMIIVTNYIHKIIPCTI